LLFWWLADEVLTRHQKRYVNGRLAELVSKQAASLMDWSLANATRSSDDVD